MNNHSNIKYDVSTQSMVKQYGFRYTNGTKDITLWFKEHLNISLSDI